MDLTEIRQIVAATLADLERAGAKPLGEMPLACDRYQLGKRFSFEGISAIWLEAAAQIRFVDEWGQLLKIVSLKGVHPSSDRAA